MPPAQGPDLSDYGYVHVAHIGRGQYANAQVVIKNNEQLVAKTVSLENLNEADQKLSHQEVSLLQRLSHPHIVAYRESFLLPDNNTLVTVMEHCEGGDLRRLIKAKARESNHLPEKQIMSWFLQLARALRFIHAEKILHRDLKTSNIFLCDIETVKLGDFGISRVLDTTTEAAVTVVGTPYYMSPEVCRNEPYNFKSDVWALGCVLYELCMLKHAFESKSLLGLVYKIVSDHYDPVPEFYSAKLNELIRRLLAKSADSRPTVLEVLEDPVFDAVEEDASPTATPTAHVASPVRHPPSLRAQAERKVFSPKAPTAPSVHEPSTTPKNVDSEILMARVRRQLVWKKLNWMSAFAAFDSKGDGLLTESEFSQCLTALHLALSGDELKVLAESLLANGGVSLAKFAQRLDRAPENGALTVENFVRKTLVASTVKTLEDACTSHDHEALGIISAQAFQIALAKVVPELTPRDAANVVLLAEKNLAGDVDYVQFLNRLREMSSQPPPPPPQVMPRPGAPNSRAAAPPKVPPLPRTASASLGGTFYTCQSIHPAGPFRAMSQEYFDIVCARMQRRLGGARLKELCLLMCGGKETVSAETLLRVVSLIPLGVSRAEVQQVVWHIAANGTSVEDVPLAHLDEYISKADVSLLREPTEILAAKQSLDGAKAVGENDLRRALMTAHPSFTASCLDRLLFLTDKTADGQILLESRNNAAAEDTKVTLLGQHLQQVQSRILQVLQRCALTQHELLRILHIFDRGNWASALSEQLPFQISLEEAFAVIPTLQDTWKEETLPNFDEQKVFDGLPDKVPLEDFLQRIGALGLPMDLVFSQNKTADGRILRPFVEGRLSQQEDTPSRKKKGFLSRFLK